LWTTTLRIWYQRYPLRYKTTHIFLRELKTLRTTNLPPGEFPLSIDVVGLYTNIPHTEGIESVNNALNKRKDPEVPASVLIELLNLVLMTMLLSLMRNSFNKNLA
jgi:hypothetical protein